MSYSVCSVAGWGLKKQLMDVFDSQSLCHQQRHGQCHGTLPETVTLGCWPQVLPKWMVPAHGWQSWSQGWWWEIHLVEARGFYLLSLGCCHWRKWREKGGERGREGKRKREKSEPGLGGVVLTSTDQWLPLSLCFTAQTRDEDIWSFWEASLLSHLQSSTLQQHYFAAGYSLSSYRIDNTCLKHRKTKTKQPGILNFARF